MGRSIESCRNHCALLGAIQTVRAVEGLLPIVHSTAGCGRQEELGLGKQGGYQGQRAALPSSNVREKQIVFGGASRLREQIKNTVKTVAADAYVVLSGCATELVGDDIPAMAKEAREQGYPVLQVAAPGFKGDVHQGYEAVVQGLLAYAAGLAPAQKHTQPGLVNLLGIIPGQDVFWQGNLLALDTLLQQAGLRANRLFGLGQTIDNWTAAASAELTLALSPWGRKAAAYLEEKAGIPYLEVSRLPVGFTATQRLLQQLGERVRLPEQTLAELYTREEQRQNYYLNQLAAVYYAAGVQREFAVVGESSFILGLQEFLTGTAGLIPKLLVVTDPLAKEEQRHLQGRLEPELAPWETGLVFSEDRQDIVTSLSRHKVELVLGSSLEQAWTERQQLPFLPVSFPASDQFWLNRSYLGFDGAVTLLEDLVGQIRQSRRQDDHKDKECVS